MISRRQYLQWCALWPVTSFAASPGGARPYEHPSPDRRLVLPADQGPHPGFRTEWWYFTGWLLTQKTRKPLGLQITFFRSAPDVPTDNPSRFSPSQLLFAHVAVADPARGQLWHDQIALRYGLADTQMRFDATDKHPVQIRIKHWVLSMQTDGTWHAHIEGTGPGQGYALDIQCVPTQHPWLQGTHGFSQKGPRPEQSSHYITLPHLQTSGRIQLGQDRYDIESGLTWMDHEWSTSVLDSRAHGWDWVGLHGLDGSALMAFSIRPGLWTHAALRRPDGQVRLFKSVRFEPLRYWRSSTTGTTYPVAMRLLLDELTFTLQPLMDSQELDARASTGTVYWEGAVQVSDTHGTLWGRGYLELTGYGKPIRL